MKIRKDATAGSKRRNSHMGVDCSGGLASPSDSSDSDEDEVSGTSRGSEYESAASSARASSRGSATRTARGCGCLPAGLD